MENTKEKWANEQTRRLFKAILKLKTIDECERYFRDLLTINELRDLAQRWEIVLMLSDEIPYREIEAKTGASTATITRVSHWLKHGEKGFKLVLNRLGH
ncbi:YerC/YecD family TrpR-related protein [Patescibacteria group bacterium]